MANAIVKLNPFSVGTVLLNSINVLAGIRSRPVKICLVLITFVSASVWSGENSCIEDSLPRMPAIKLTFPNSDGWFKHGVAPFGVNTLFWIEDDQAWQHTAMPRLLKNMGVQALRFPAGEVSDNYDWERNGLEDSTRWPGENGGEAERRTRTDYLELLANARKLGVEHIFFVVNVDAAFRAAGDLDTNLQRYAEKAARWVKAVKKAGYRVPYWEIGNETYLSESPLTAVEYAKAVNVFSKAMRSEDPDIRIGATGPAGARGVGFADRLTREQLREFRSAGNSLKKVCPNSTALECVEKLQTKFAGGQVPEPWWPTLLKEAGDSFDFAVIHRYERAEIRNDRARKGVFALSDATRRLSAMLKLAKRKYVPIALTEWNTPDEESIGTLSQADHLLNIAIQIGNNLSGGVDYALYWPLRLPGEKFKPLFAMNGESMLPVANLFSAMSAFSTVYLEVAESSPVEGVYVLQGRQQNGWGLMVVNTTVQPYLIQPPTLFGKAGSLTLRRFISQGGLVDIQRECSQPVVDIDTLSFAVQPRSVFLVNIKR